MKLLKVISVLCFVALCGIQVVWAQCSTCKGQLENADPQVAVAVNQGILYLLALPFILAATIGIIWYKKQQAFIQRMEKERLARLDRPVDAGQLYHHFPPSPN